MKLFLPFVLWMISFIWIDRSVALAVQTVAPTLSPLFSFASFLIAPAMHLTLWSLLFFGSFWIDVLRKRRIAIFQVLLLIIVIMFITGISKLVFSRARPSIYLEEGVYGFLCNRYSNEFRSFPSSHAAVAFGLGYFFFRQLRVKMLLVFGALLSLSRIVLNEHFMSDIMAGAFIGIMVAKGLLTLIKNGQIEDLPAEDW